LPPLTDDCPTTGLIYADDQRVAMAYDQPVVVVADPNVLTLTMTMPNDGKLYYFAVTAIDPNGIESPLTNEGSKYTYPGQTENITIVWGALP
jgi:fibronectin type 3 domain-containing protein